MRLIVILAWTLCVLCAGVGANAVVSLDRCENNSLWQTQVAGYNPFNLQPYSADRKEGQYCLRATFDPGWGYASNAIFRPSVGWGAHAYLSFWLKADGAYKSQHKLRITCDSDDGVLAIDKYIDLGFDGWIRVRLRLTDFAFFFRQPSQIVDWTTLKTFWFGVTEGNNKPAIYLDDICYEDEDLSSVPLAEDLVVVDNCESTASWSAEGIVSLSAKPELHQEGANCLYVRYAGPGTGRAIVQIPERLYSRSHAVSFKFRGSGSSTAKCRLSVRSSNGASFDKDIDAANSGWTDFLLFPDDFHRTPNADGELPEWENLDSFSLTVDNPGNEQGEVLLDAVQVRRVVADAAIKQNPDPRVWWWDGGFDPYCTMHAVYADWPHLESEPARPAILKFSEFILSPLVPYTVFVHNDLGYSRFWLTITDWELNLVERVEIPQPGAGVTALQLKAPAINGTYICTLECINASGTVTGKYQTGIMVLAKRLSEPKGIWGIHGYIGQKGQGWPHHDVVLRMFQATGITCLRERFPLPVTMYTSDPLSTPAGNVCRLAKDRNIEVDVTVSVLDPKYFVNGNYRDGLLSNMRTQFENDWEALTRTWRGLVRWYEYGNEPNDVPIAPYADSMKLAYAGGKRGDPDSEVVMGGAHVIDGWQYQLWEMENQTGIPYQDALATHLYPEITSLETTMRSWITGLGPALGEKGMIMTESGWLTFDTETQFMLKTGLTLHGAGEPESQAYYAMYAPVILGECMKMNSALYGVYFFEAMPAMGDYIFTTPEELRVWSTGHYVGKWGTREITMGRPMVYTHNTIARLLTHEVTQATASVNWDTALGTVEHYAFHRPGETIVCLWVGVKGGSRASQIDATVQAPSDVVLALAVDINGNERIVPVSGGSVHIELERDRPVFLRMLSGSRNGNTLQIGMENLPPSGFSIMKGTPENNPEIVEGISRDRNLPMVSDVVPALGTPMVLYSKVNNTLYVVGRTEGDVEDAATDFQPVRVLFSDSFDASRDFASLNDEFMVGRQTGSLVSSGQLTYTEWENENRPWRVYLCGPSTHEPVAGGIAFTTMGEPAPGGESVGMRLNYNFEDYNSFALSVDCDPIVENRSSYSNDQDWSAIRFGTGFEDWGLGQGIVFKLYHSGAWEASVLGDLQGSGAVAKKLPQAGSLLPCYYNLRFEVRQAGNSDPADIKAFIDGTEVWSYTFASGLQNNKISLVSYGYNGWGVDTGTEYHAWDNLSMSLLIPDPDPSTIAQVRLMRDCDYINCSGIVSAVFDGYFYVQAPDRSGGIRVQKTGHGLQAGKNVKVVGRLGTMSGERYIAADTVAEIDSVLVDVHPLGLSNRSLGGGDFGYPDSGEGQYGVNGGSGLNNIGLLVKTTGRVIGVDTASTPVWFRIDDGSGVEVKAVVPSGAGVPSIGSYVAVTGISSCEDGVRVLRVRGSGDVLVVQIT